VKKKRTKANKNTTKKGAQQEASGTKANKKTRKATEHVNLGKSQPYESLNQFSELIKVCWLSSYLKKKVKF